MPLDDEGNPPPPAAGDPLGRTFDDLLARGRPGRVQPVERLTGASDAQPKILVLDRGEELVGQLQGLADDFRPVPDVVGCTRMGSVAEVLEEQGPFDVLVAGPSLGTRSGLARLRVIREDQPGTSLVLAFSRRPDADLTDIVRTGAIDLLRLPVEDGDLVDTVEPGRQPLADAERREQAAVEAAAVTNGHAAAAASSPAGSSRSRRPPAGAARPSTPPTSPTSSPATRGSGPASSTSTCSSARSSTALRMRPKFTIFDALQREDTDEDDLENHIEEYTVVHETGVHVLAAPREPSEADRISPPDVTRILEAVRKNFDYVVVDTPPQLNELVLAAFDLSDELYVMATLDLPSVRNMSVFLSTLDRLKVPADNVKLILNKAESDVGIDIDQVTRLFPQGFESVLPYAKEVVAVDQPRHARHGRVAAGGDQPADDHRHAACPAARAPVEGRAPSPSPRRRACSGDGTGEGVHTVKLSEKLAALEEEEKQQAPPPRRPPRPRPVAPAASQDHAARAGSWDATKRKVRDLVLEEVAPKMQGLTGEELVAEVKAALDRILGREDVQVSPAGAAQVRPGDDRRHPRLRPARPAARRRHHHRSHVQHLRRHLDRARGPPRAHRHCRSPTRRSTAR